jgi:hypothetical protein
MNRQEGPKPIEETRALIIHLCNAIHNSALTVQVFTRVPGTIGVALMFLPLWVGLVCMVLFCGIIVPPELSTSLAPFQFVRIALGASAVNVLVSLIGPHRYSYSCGAPWLEPFMRKANWWVAGSINDAVLSSAAAVLAWNLGMDNLSIWFVFAGCICAPLSQLHIEARDCLRRRSIGDSVAQQRLWEEYSRPYLDQEE